MTSVDQGAPSSGRPQVSSGGRIVVGIDDSPAGLAALRWAVEGARTANAQLVAVRSWALGLPRHGGRRRHRGNLHPHVVLVFDGTEQRDASAKLVRKAFHVAVGGVPRDVTVTIETPQGDPGAVLTGIAAADGDLLVVGANRHPSARRLVHGSVSRYCCLHAHCPVVVIPAGPEAGTARFSADAAGPALPASSSQPERQGRAMVSS
jgi:nucleotide-binding universal stress UspA family protein